MSEILKRLETRLNESWMLGYNSHYFYQLTQFYINNFIEIKSSILYPKIILAHPKPDHFLSAFLAAMITQCHLFLGNYQWTEKEWKRVLNLTQPNLILGLDNPPQFNLDNNQQNCLLPETALIMIPTGGSSGNIKFAIHTWETLSASVQGFTQFFKVNQINSFCVLPLYHVSGLMQFMRSFLTQGKIIIYAYSDLKKGLKPSRDVRDYFISLVPTQLQRLLEIDSHWLTNFKTILLGGAPPWNSLLETARNYQLNLSPTYGMTETASQIVTLKPQDFLQGNQSTGQILPHAKIYINEPTKVINVQAKSLFLGYYPNLKKSSIFVTDDLGYYDHEHYLYIMGRNSQKIITGGENVFPKEVENAILETGLVKDVSVIGIPHPQWGEAVTAVYVAHTNSLNVQDIQTAIRNQLSYFKQPKYWIKLEKLPRNQQGKLNYQILQNIALTHIKPGDKLQ
ncbi:2-succinylbenzoate--CoA ligase [Crocosphaera sp. UHCC 0190]|uniref:2-succinylbenzoate--CoA ligase n=1 Tax=Crocosphaera sp. UHCC 0190 TaxID=3110246 RepID=UPI002B1EBC6C|nr:2-succinylbenzoate--CoA ligase [Crocosphaera sp. UHCC 0190]MEA5510022.1 2-succinylbenzoate--CoA ligase [Crocosphaera sp. UHCC 0190]